MRLVVITPVGPGHQEYVKECAASVRREIERCKTFSASHLIIDDTEGKLGRSKARNIGLETPADWYFLIDADDTMEPGALDLCDFESPATFGAINLKGQMKAGYLNIYPCGWREIRRFGAVGTLSMGFFLRGDIGLKFNEGLDAGEDFEFYLRLPHFTKVESPLVEIGYDRPSATGPRGYERIDWVSVCRKHVDRAVRENPDKYDLYGDALLEA